MSSLNIGFNDKIHLGIHSIANIAQLTGYKKLSPVAISWRLTYSCNFSCLHCSSHLNKYPIQTDKLLDVAYKIADSHTSIVVLSGGEPLIVPNIKQIITVLKNAGKHVAIDTNGYLLDKFADFFLDIGLNSIAVSFDGADSKTNDFIRNKKGAFETVINNLKYIKENRKNKKPHIGIRGTVMRYNFRTIPQYIEKFANLADDIKFQPVHNQEFHHSVSKEKVLFKPKDNKMESELVEIINLTAKKYSFLNNNYYKSFPKFIFHPEQIKKEVINHCIPVLFFALRINPDGSCNTCTKKTGDIYKESINKIWTNPERINFLKNLSKTGYCNHPCWYNSHVIENQLPGKILKKIFKIMK
jgi:MoaA/NifB/PqqE/SkfB family radical SAM enzyme